MTIASPVPVWFENGMNISPFAMDRNFQHFIRYFQENRRKRYYYNQAVFQVDSYSYSLNRRAAVRFPRNVEIIGITIQYEAPTGDSAQVTIKDGSTTLWESELVPGVTGESVFSRQQINLPLTQGVTYTLDDEGSGAGTSNNIRVVFHIKSDILNFGNPANFTFTDVPNFTQAVSATTIAAAFTKMSDALAAFIAARKGENVNIFTFKTLTTTYPDHAGIIRLPRCGLHFRRLILGGSVSTSDTIRVRLKNASAGIEEEVTLTGSTGSKQMELVIVDLDVAQSALASGSISSANDWTLEIIMTAGNSPYAYVTLHSE
jgi:hypothetical protein